jgi:hypothetical protein
MAQQQQYQSQGWRFEDVINQISDAIKNVQAAKFTREQQESSRISAIGDYVKSLGILQTAQNMQAQNEIFPHMARLQRETEPFEKVKTDASGIVAKWNDLNRIIKESMASDKTPDFEKKEYNDIVKGTRSNLLKLAYDKDSKTYFIYVPPNEDPSYVPTNESDASVLYVAKETVPGQKLSALNDVRIANNSRTNNFDKNKREQHERNKKIAFVELFGINEIPVIQKEISDADKEISALTNKFNEISAGLMKNSNTSWFPFMMDQYNPYGWRERK